jgi:Icc-related predicted phosphoesterase
MRNRGRLLSAKIILGGLRGRKNPDVFVTHAPPLGLGDQQDPCHTGFETFHSLIDRHRPSLWLHGHVHLYGPKTADQRVTSRGETRVVNVYGHQILAVPKPRSEMGCRPTRRVVE